MKRMLLIIICALVLSTSLFAQDEPTKSETAGYILSKVTSFADGYAIGHDFMLLKNEYLQNDNSELALTSNNNVTVNVYFSNLDANGIAWGMYTYGSQLLSVTIPAKNGALAYNSTDGRFNGNKIVFYFDITKVSGAPNFQESMTKAFKRMILLCGGVPEKQLF